MTREERKDAIKFFEGVAEKEIGNAKYSKLAIEALKQQDSCEDAISRQAVLDLPKNTERGFGGKILEQSINIEYIKALPPVTPAEKVGRWILVQREKYIDINCSECGSTRVKEYAYNYTIDEIDIQEVEDLVVTSKMNYCECCGAKMQGVSK